MEAGAASLYLELVEAGMSITAAVTLDAASRTCDAKPVPLHSTSAPALHPSAVEGSRGSKRREEAAVASGSASGSVCGSGSESEASQAPTHVQCRAGEEAGERRLRSSGAGTGIQERDGLEHVEHHSSPASTSSSTSVPQADYPLGGGGCGTGPGGEAVGGGVEVTPGLEPIVAFVGLTPEQMAAKIEVDCVPAPPL